LDVIREPVADVLEERLPAELRAVRLDREQAPVRKLDPVLRRERVWDLDPRTRDELRDDLRDLPGRHEWLARRAVEDPVGRVGPVEARDGEARDVGRVRVVAREGPS